MHLPSAITYLRSGRRNVSFSSCVQLLLSRRNIILIRGEIVCIAWARATWPMDGGAQTHSPAFPVIWGGCWCCCFCGQVLCIHTWKLLFSASHPPFSRMSNTGTRSVNGHARPHVRMCEWTVRWFMVLWSSQLGKENNDFLKVVESHEHRRHPMGHTYAMEYLRTCIDSVINQIGSGCVALRMLKSIH